MKHLLFAALILSGCATVKKNKETSRTETKTETLTITDQVTRERVDTLVTIAPRSYSAPANLPQLFAGVQVGAVLVKYDTITKTVYVKTKPEQVTVYIDREIRSTIKDQVKQEIATKDKKKETERELPTWVKILILIAFLLCAFWLARKF